MERTTRAAPAGSEFSEQEAYDELQSYTLALMDHGFIHQHVVDAWAAQHTDERTKPINVAFQRNISQPSRRVARDSPPSNHYR